jgi:pimeloyl-ACP methyl ester carboxylesterase
MKKTIYHKEFINHPAGYQSCLHRFQPNVGKGTPVLMIHGSIEDSRIFHSASGKGLAPYLAENGFDVFAPDLPGKGQSKPRASRSFDHSMQDFIDKDINDYISHIRQFHPDEKIRLVGHSWGGVVLLAWYAKYGNTDSIGPMAFFGTKRRIAVISPIRLFAVDTVWTLLGSFSTFLAGYLPAVKLKIGSDNEPRTFYRETNRWVYSKNWKDIKSGEDISALLKEKSKPPLLFFAGIKDYFLGHPKDVKRLIAETGAKDVKYVLLSKKSGHQRDYGHIDMLTSKTSRVDHFPIVLAWLNQGSK